MVFPPPRTDPRLKNPPLTYLQRCASPEGPRAEEQGGPAKSEAEQGESAHAGGGTAERMSSQEMGGRPSCGTHSRDKKWERPHGTSEHAAKPPEVSPLRRCLGARVLKGAEGRCVRRCLGHQRIEGPKSLDPERNRAPGRSWRIARAWSQTRRPMLSNPADRCSSAVRVGPRQRRCSSATAGPRQRGWSLVGSVPVLPATRDHQTELWPKKAAESSGEGTKCRTDFEGSGRMHVPSVINRPPNLS